MTDREIVVALAEKVIGLPLYAGNPGVSVSPSLCPCFYPHHCEYGVNIFNWDEAAERVEGEYFNPLESIADAFQVEDSIRGLGWMLELEVVRLLATDQPSWRARFRKWGSPDSESAEAPSAPRAICLAALRAVSR